MHRVLSSLTGLIWLAAFMACSDRSFPDGEAATASQGGGSLAPQQGDSAPHLDTPALPADPGPELADPVAALEALLPAVPGYCVQVRSVEDRGEAERIAAAIRGVLAEEVVLLQKDLGERGTWWRVCVGLAATEDETRRAGQRWTDEAGPLLPFLTAVAPGQARFLVLPRRGRPTLSPTAAMAETLWRARPRATRPPTLFLVDGAVYGAVAWGGDDGASPGVVVVGSDGVPLPFDLAAPAGSCAACAEALPLRPSARRWVAVADVAAAPGDEIVVTEQVGEGPEVLSVYTVHEGRLLRVAWFLLSTAGAAGLVEGEAYVREADSAPGDELVLRRYEQRRLGDDVCELKIRVDVVDLRAPTPRRLEEGWAEAMAAAESSGGAAATLAFIETLDALDDVEQASEVCAAYLARGRDPTLAARCLQRIRDLEERGAVLEALNAAARLSSSAPALRGAVASPLYLLARRFGDAPGLTAVRPPCGETPLLREVGTAAPAALFARAEDARRSTPSLDEVSPAFFTTATRDFGPSTPLGTIASGWLATLARVAPAHHARLITEAQARASMANAPSRVEHGGRGMDTPAGADSVVSLPPPVDKAPVVGEKGP